MTETEVHPVHGTAPVGWLATAETGTCEYCGKTTQVRNEPFGENPACWFDWAQICYGGDDE